MKISFLLKYDLTNFNSHYNGIYALDEHTINAFQTGENKLYVLLYGKGFILRLIFERAEGNKFIAKYLNEQVNVSLLDDKLSFNTYEKTVSKYNGTYTKKSSLKMLDVLEQDLNL